MAAATNSPALAQPFIRSLYTTLLHHYNATAPSSIQTAQPWRRLNLNLGHCNSIFYRPAAPASSSRRPSMQGRDGVFQSHLPNRAETCSTPFSFRLHPTYIRNKGVLLLRLARALQKLGFYKCGFCFLTRLEINLLNWNPVNLSCCPWGRAFFLFSIVDLPAIFNDLLSLAP